MAQNESTAAARYPAIRGSRVADERRACRSVPARFGRGHECRLAVHDDDRRRQRGDGGDLGSGPGELAQRALAAQVGAQHVLAQDSYLGTRLGEGPKQRARGQQAEQVWPSGDRVHDAGAPGRQVGCRRRHLGQAQVVAGARWAGAVTGPGSAIIPVAASLSWASARSKANSSARPAVSGLAAETSWTVLEAERRVRTASSGIDLPLRRRRWSGALTLA
jgi:hypothetical protein